MFQFQARPSTVALYNRQGSSTQKDQSSNKKRTNKGWVCCGIYKKLGRKFTAGAYRRCWQRITKSISPHLTPASQGKAYVLNKRRGQHLALPGQHCAARLPMLQEGGRHRLTTRCLCQSHRDNKMHNVPTTTATSKCCAPIPNSVSKLAANGGSCSFILY